MKITYDPQKRRVLELDIEDMANLYRPLARELVKSDETKQPVRVIRMPVAATLYGVSMEYIGPFPQELALLQQLQQARVEMLQLVRERVVLYEKLQESIREKIKMLEQHIRSTNQLEKLIKGLHANSRQDQVKP